jgi:hypothetical protein
VSKQETLSGGFIKLPLAAIFYEAACLEVDIAGATPVHAKVLATP